MQSESGGLRAYSHEGEIFDQRDRRINLFFFSNIILSRICQELSRILYKER